MNLNRYVTLYRSPLNVVHAGLDILRSELGCMENFNGLFGQVSESTAELIEDIYTASETAISILNDLLHYEHMDAGLKEHLQILTYCIHMLLNKITSQVLSNWNKLRDL